MLGLLGDICVFLQGGGEGGPYALSSPHQDPPGRISAVCGPAVAQTRNGPRPSGEEGRGPVGCRG
ncbi:hypothetical protein PL81_36395 [Streptomyces sp. RSD-27]|nr:hypothetical protein PL81_36395 [Streptomyces sp. RSD-27]